MSIKSSIINVANTIKDMAVSVAKTATETLSNWKGRVVQQIKNNPVATTVTLAVGLNVGVFAVLTKIANCADAALVKKFDLSQESPNKVILFKNISIASAVGAGVLGANLLSGLVVNKQILAAITVSAVCLKLFLTKKIAISTSELEELNRLSTVAFASGKINPPLVAKGNCLNH